MLVSDYDFYLPEELIAQNPATKRTDSRMLVMNPTTGNCSIHHFPHIASLLRKGDCLVINDTKVIPARLYGKRNPTGGKVEAFMLEEVNNTTWNCMLKPGRRLNPGEKVEIDNSNNNHFIVSKRHNNGTFEVTFNTNNVYALLEQAGHIPLPPYIQRTASNEDAKRYQTVYAKHPGAVAAPTAGLHFTPEILKKLKKIGVTTARVTLHVGPGTFQPVKAENLQNHQMHEETFILSNKTAELINKTRQNNGRIIAIGTTSVRVLESCAENGKVIPQSGKTRLFMHPPKKPQITNGLLTNFHLPKSTLLMLVSCFSTREKILEAYQLAIRQKLRFYSYGDCMLLLEETTQKQSNS